MTSKGNSRFFSSLALLLGVANGLVVVNNNFAQQTYDFIIVGGGTAGNVLANRLTENPNYQVLVLEAGPSNQGVEVIQIPFTCTDVTPFTPYDWNYTTTAQTGLNDRTLPYPRGFVLGGSSSANFLIYTRGTSDDFNQYANVIGDSGFNWDNMMQYFYKNEKWQAPVDGHNTTGQYNPAVHSTTGINSVSLAGFPSSIDNRIINASSQLGGDFEFNLDQNSGYNLGLGWMQSTTNGPDRSSSATSYLGPSYISRPNLYVAVGAQVSRVIQTGTQNGNPVFNTVEFQLASGGPLQTITAGKEVILSAGSIGSPHILMNSGIGNATELAAFGIKSLVELPSVGRNLSDHPFGAVTFYVNSTQTYDDFFRNSTVHSQDISQWQNTGTGQLVDTVASHVVFARLPADVLATVEDTSTGPDSPHFELLIANGDPFATPETGYFLTVGTVVLQPTARGSVTLQSSNPFTAPIINPNILGSSLDLTVIREATKAALNFVTAPAWSNYVITPYGPLANGTSDPQIDAYTQATTGTIFHPIGTARMTPVNATDGVVNPDFTVKQVAGLRIVDGSILPFLPSAHPQAPIYAFAERASDIIKAAYN